MIARPTDFDVCEHVVIYSRDGVEVNYDQYGDGRPYEANWPIGTHGSTVAELIGMVPPTALDMGEEWITDEDTGRTYAAYWEAA